MCVFHPSPCVSPGVSSIKLRHFSPESKDMNVDQTQRSQISNKLRKTTSATVTLSTGQAALTVVVFLTALPEPSVKISESKLVFARLPNVMHCIGQLPLSDLGQLFPPGRGQCAVVGVLGRTLCMAAGQQESSSVCWWVRTVRQKRDKTALVLTVIDSWTVCSFNQITLKLTFMFNNIILSDQIRSGKSPFIQLLFYSPKSSVILCKHAQF